MHDTQPPSRCNHACFAVFMEDAYPLSRDEPYERLREHNMFTRRYFFALISEFSMYVCFPSAAPDNLVAACDAASRVFCLPLYPCLDEVTLQRITRIIIDGQA
ncbi:MAG: dTDP-4-amino-4,6-dideoxygalactose transaminase [Halieaceae bacterium]|jgi:dTDP-4-amino-4,6-dideoxygalactose transaminase